MKLSNELAKQANQFNICQEWHDELKTLEDKSAMVRMYLKGIDFCLANDFPSNEYIRRNFSDIMNEFGVFLDDMIDLVNVEKCVALGNTKGRIETTDFGTAEVFIKHSSEITIIARDNAFVMVDVFDNAHVHVQAHGRAKVCVNRYGNSHIENEIFDVGMVKIIEKYKKTY